MTGENGVKVGPEDEERREVTHVCTFSDPGSYVIAVGARRYRFDYSDIFGPSVVDRSGREIAQPSHRSPFWRAVSLWALQGKRIDDGMCVWHEPAQPVCEQRGGQWHIVEHGDAGSD